MSFQYPTAMHEYHRSLLPTTRNELYSASMTRPNAPTTAAPTILLLSNTREAPLNELSLLSSSSSSASSSLLLEEVEAVLLELSEPLPERFDVAKGVDVEVVRVLEMLVLEGPEVSCWEVCKYRADQGRKG